MTKNGAGNAAGEPGKKKSHNTGKENGTKSKRTREYFEEMAKNPKSRVILADTADTYVLSDLTIQANRGITKARDQVLRNLPLEIFGELMDDYGQKLLDLEVSIQNLCKATKTPYVRPRGIKLIEQRLKGERVVEENGETPKEDAPTKKAANA